MKKIGPFLEKNIEWITMALGACFLLYMAWIYIISDPVSKKISYLKNKLETPADIDNDIANGPARDLQNKISSPVNYSAKIGDYTTALKDSVAMKTLPDVQSMTSIWDFDPYDPNVGVVNINNNSNGQQQGNQNVAVKDLPKPPPAAIILVATGQSTVLDSTGAKKDLNWAAVEAHIPPAALQTEWGKTLGAGGAKLQGQNTVVLSATLLRRQKLPNGAGWSDFVEVPRLDNNQLPPFPDKNNITDPNALKPAQDKWVQEVSKSPAEVIAPDFLKAAPTPSGTDVPTADALLKLAANPPAPAAAATAAPPVATPPAGGTAAAGAPPVQAMPVAAPVNTAPNILIATGGLVNPAPIVPAGMFDPDPAAPATPPDVLFCLFDGTIRPNVTYQYVIEYTLYNPICRNVLVNAKPGLTDVYALDPARSDASPEVTLESKTKFYVATPGQGNNWNHSVKFNVYTTAAGQEQMQTFTVYPGEPIGGNKDNIDYTTGYSYVDGWGTTGNQLAVAVMDADGTVTVRDAARDVQQDGRDHPKAAPTAGTTGAPGGPTGANPDIPGMILPNRNPGGRSIGAPPDSPADQRGR